MKLTIDTAVKGQLKADLLSKGVNFDLGLFANYPGSFYANQYVYGNVNKAQLEDRIPQVLLLGDGVITQVLRRENSPYQVRLVGEVVELHHDGEFVQALGLPEVPAYFGTRLRDGTLADKIIAVAGEDTPGFFIYPKCYYFPQGAPCGFCSLAGTRNSVAKDMQKEFTDTDIAEATQLLQSTLWRPLRLISFTAGTPTSDGGTRKHIIQSIRATYDALNPKVPIHALVHPPNDFSLIDEYHEAGVTSIAFNLEIFDRQLFEEIVPGKAKRYGRDKWLKALDYACGVFGPYNVFSGLVWGLEPPESTMEGHRFFLDRGIGIASNVFHSDPKSVLRSHPHPPTEDILRIARDQSDLYLRYPEARTIFSVSMRSTTDWEVYRGDLR